MKLYFTPGTCSLADHIALEWTGKPYDAQLVTREERRQPAYLAINPAGAVPSLDVDGWILTQNAAILNWIADTCPESKLGGDGSAKSRAIVNQWLSIVNSDVHPLFKVFFGAADYLEDQALIDKAQDNARTALRTQFERIDRQLAGKDYVAGERSIVDPYLYVVLRWAKGSKVDLSGLENLHAFHDRMRNDPGVRRALDAQGLS
ncbi:glutathione S-transferase N-terminal domain-containing protein [Lysobacter sp. A6]|uniref:Glutathione S-transferase N-terminal domain-containing protein n=1 Tax=Noviluteimonas lactosilytica TaxID=2888523 RepID=A0ABS8JFF0_9GAMM|nr:glutathione binding-like protein [Lysobacter lactosilyticus]MCC8362289.1 glutathione S-transferase N-terminal domain-containing protein [Lysobacter lactosilyticus]